MAEIYVIAIDALTFDQVATATPNRVAVSVEHAIIFEQNATCIVTNVDNGLNYTRTVEQELTFSQQARPGLIRVSAENTLYLDQRANRIISVSTQNYLSFSQAPGRVKEGIAHQLLVFSQYANPYAIHDHLIFNHSAIGFRVRVGKNTLTFTSTASYNIVKLCPVAQALLFDSFGVGYIVHPRIILDTIENPPIEYAGVRLTYGTLVLDLPAPEFDDTNSLDQTRLNMRSRGGDLIIFRDPIWPQAETLSMRWEKLKDTQLRDLLIFLKVALGQVVLLKTHEGRLFNVIIQSPDGDGSQITQARYGASLDFHVVGNELFV